MGNVFTGDFEAVLQVSGKTLNRLAASMHQNAGGNPDTPSFPHSLWLRMGDDGMVDGVRGTLQAEICTPQIELVNASTDRFFLSAAIRAWFQADPGTTPFPAFIKGAFRAEYRLTDIDQKCLGWASRAADYLWIRVVPESVTFEGGLSDDTNLMLMLPDPGAEAARHELFVRQIAAALAGPFEATPHPVSKRFRNGSLISLAGPGESGLALPLGITGNPSGAITSIANLFLAGEDFAFALREDLLMALLAPSIAAIQDYKPSVHVHISTPWPAPDIDTDYNGSLDPISVSWQPHGSFAVIHIHARGHLHTGSVLADASFTVDQDIFVNFNAGDETLWLSVGSRSVTANASGLGSGAISDGVSGAVDAVVKAFAEAACTGARSQLDAMIARKQELIDQLRGLDGGAGARFTNASFEPDGIVLRGRITVSSRHAGKPAFELTQAKDGYSALASWFPGGRIDKFEWSWTWPDNSTKATTLSDRFLLRRPHPKPGKWGTTFNLTDPLPGLDGSGTLCLRISGAQIDAVTGDWVHVESTRICHRYGFAIRPLANGAVIRPLSREVAQTKPHIPHPELALTSLGEGAASNALVAYVGPDWDEEATRALYHALEATHRHDAGLMLLALFSEGEAGKGEHLARQFQEMGRALGLVTLVQEDVDASWATNLAVPQTCRDSVWRLITPEGGISWALTGAISADELSKALTHCLLPSQAPSLRPVEPKLAIGARFGQGAFRGAWPIRLAHCPPPPFNRLAKAAGSLVSFVRQDSAASRAHVRRLKAEYGHETGPLVALILEGADAHKAAHFSEEVGLPVLPDPGGAITDRMGISVWPTTFSLDKSGILRAIDYGPLTEEEGRRV
ncbi:hypothetical protein FHS83_000474 [Rhizomicrobium palustre]|uniref:Uncharacterized protein n=1 Tax=Rhizomicrobium palustre TaxID=189966 RepID=A0A846MUW5_9PROT|nr:hypothetical protein [Rhizomicrobium palustre]NIK87156.1 hypothetical protein [Rhizomicrobium palustre]